MVEVCHFFHLFDVCSGSAMVYTGSAFGSALNCKADQSFFLPPVSKPLVHFKYTWSFFSRSKGLLLKYLRSGSFLVSLGFAGVNSGSAISEPEQTMSGHIKQTRKLVTVWSSLIGTVNHKKNFFSTPIYIRENALL